MAPSDIRLDTFVAKTAFFGHFLAILELEGEEEEITSGLEWVRSIGVRVDPVSGDVVES